MKDLTNEKVIRIREKKITNHGYISEVDLEYRKKLFTSHNDNPLAPEKLKIDNTEKTGQKLLSQISPCIAL